MSSLACGSDQIQHWGSVGVPSVLMERYFFFCSLRWKNHFVVLKGSLKKKVITSVAQHLVEIFIKCKKYLFCPFFLGGLTDSNWGPMKNLSNIILVLRHGDSFRRTGRLCAFFRKWIACLATEMRQRVKCYASRKVGYFLGRLLAGAWKEQQDAETANWLSHWSNTRYSCCPASISHEERCS